MNNHCEGRGWFIDIQPDHTQWCGPSGCAPECPEPVQVQVQCPGCFDCLDAINPRGPESELLKAEDLPW